MRVFVFFVVLFSYNINVYSQSEDSLQKGRNPSDIVNLLFEAAKTGNPELLKNLCPPSKENDGDTDCICALNSEYQPHKCDENSPNHVTWNGFVEYFKKGKIIGNTEILNNYARVPILFGIDGKKPETMKLIKIKGTWYLSSF